MSPPPLSWHQVLDAEVTALFGPEAAPGPVPLEPPGHTRAHPTEGPPVRPDEHQLGELRSLYARIHRKAPSALCLSGGGIRSATFALGVLQGLARLGVLGRFDYLSTVSGGGYTGGWFTTWLHRQGPDRRDEVFSAMDPAQAASRRLSQHEATPVDHVRRTCRYLAPTGGVVSADLWTVYTTMARNLLLNWFVILPLLAAALLVPRAYYATAYLIEEGLTHTACLTADNAALPLLIAALACFAVSVGYIALTFAGRASEWSQGRFLTWCLVPLLAGAIAITLFWAAYPCHVDLASSVLVAAAVPAVGWTVIGWLAPQETGAVSAGRVSVRPGIRTVLAAASAGAILGLTAWWFATHEFGFGPGEPLRELYAAFAVPLLLAIVMFAAAIFVGFASSALDDGALEWWSRAGAWVAIAVALWVSASVLVFYMADLLDAALRGVEAALQVDRHTTGAILSGLIPLLGSLAGLAARASSGARRPTLVGRLAQAVALPVIIVLLLSSMAWLDMRGLEWLEYHRLDAATACMPSHAGQEPCHPRAAGLGEVALLGGLLLALGLVMSWFVPVNRFSLHGMYRQRLIRTFLGASRTTRQPNPFTGFDGDDDLRVHELADVRPLHVINTTLNAVKSTHIGRHQHQAESFTITPLAVGNPVVGYRRAAEYGSDGSGGALASGLSLGMALAVSGAAASSAMGIYSSKARAFLLTLANARLGLWFGNPSDPHTWQSSEPPLGVGPIARELLGLTTDSNAYVYLSDGGHYENLGMWEMVARRCRYVVVSDAGCDPDYTFDDLGNAVRRIRLDLGIPVLIDRLPMTRAGQGTTNLHVAMGTIKYSVVDGPDAPDGTLLYFKSTLSGDEPVDVWNFAQANPAFPHDSTANQFFDEARFESYRTLGYHTVQSLAPHFVPGSGVAGLCEAARLTGQACAAGDAA